MTAALVTRLERPIPRWLLIAGVPIGGFALTLLFVLLGFPYDRLAHQAAFRVERVTGVRVEIGELAPRISLRGPGMRAKDVRINRPGQHPLDLSRIFIRPAWSTSWLRLVPSIFVDARGPVGKVSGAITIGSEPGFAGSFEGLVLAELPLETLLGGATLDGALSGEADIFLDETDGGPVGTLAFDAREGSVTVPASPIGIPYETIEGALEFGGDHLARVESLEVEGPMLSASLAGSVGKAAAMGRNPLDLDLKIKVVDPTLRQMIGRRVRFESDGTAQMRVTGTLAAPVVR